MVEVHSIHQREPGSRQSRSRFVFPVFFDRVELNQILSVYSRRVIAGEWCDYGFNEGRHEATFAIYKTGGVSRDTDNREEETLWKTLVVE